MRVAEDMSRSGTLVADVGFDCVGVVVDDERLSADRRSGIVTLT